LRVGPVEIRLAVTGPVVKLVEMRLAMVESAEAELAEGPAEVQPAERLVEIEIVRRVKVL
jgi:hypothetical protein